MDGGPRRREPEPEAPLAKLGPPPMPTPGCEPPDESAYGGCGCGGCTASACPCDVPVREEWRRWRCPVPPGYALGGAEEAPDWWGWEWLLE